MVREEDLIFELVRSGTDQWEVSHDGRVIARVTERVVASPVYSVILIENSLETEYFRESRDEVVSFILSHVNKG